MLVIVDFMSVITSGILVNVMTTTDSMCTVNIFGSVGPLSSALPW